MKKTSLVKSLAVLLLGVCLASPGVAQERHSDEGRPTRTERRDLDRDHDRDDDRKPQVQVALTVPAVGTVAAAPATLTLAASAQALQNSHRIVRVEFYQGSTLIGTTTTAPYSLTWNNVPAGRYSLTAKAYGRATERRDARDERERDHDGHYDVAVSAPVPVIVDAPPTVALTAPTPNQVVNAPATIALAATAIDSDGTVAKVEFYQGATLIGTATAAPYTISWANVPAGSYTLTAVATDDRGVTTTSAPVAVTVNAPPTVAITAPADNAHRCQCGRQ